MRLRPCWFSILLLSFTLAGSQLSASPISINGEIGGEWAGATVKSVLFDSSAPIGNFGTPGNTNASGYDIYTRADATYFYVGLTVTQNYVGNNFANLYFDTDPGTGSDIGFEVTLNQAFIPGVPGYYPYTPGANDIHYAVLPGVIEFAVPFSFFTTDPLGIGFPVATTAVQLRLSQAFGYSVAGGTTYGDDRLGTLDIPTAAVPEPASLALCGIGVAGFALWRRRKPA